MRRASSATTSTITASFGLALAALACGGAQPTPTEPAPPSAPVATAPPAPSSTPTATPTASASGADDACDVDTDCEHVELGCCDHCNGGKLGAFNKAHASKHRPTCEPTRCTRRGCGAATVRCASHHCVAGVEGL